MRALPLLVLLAAAPALAQSDTGPIPSNPALAASPWPVFHRTPYAQASTPLRGPEPGEPVAVQYLRTPNARVSPWSLLSEAYSDGSRAVWGATSTHVFKALLDGPTFEMVDDVRIDRTPLEVHWNAILLRGNRLLVPDRDPVLFAKAIEQIIDEPMLAQSMATAAATRAARYTWSFAAARLRRLYTDLTARQLVLGE